jgi:hypothetical protein
VTAWASKSAEQALRLAGVMQLVEDPEAAHISAGVMERALELASWYLAEAVRLAGTCAVPKSVRDAEQPLEWMRRKGLQAVHPQQMLQEGPNALRDKSALNAAVEVLVGAGWLMPLPEGTPLDGKPRKRSWRVWQSSTP